MKQPIPVTVVSGFLGSGKTTLLCGLLERRQERRLAVLINEIGDISIDGALVRVSAGAKSAGSTGVGAMGEVEIVDFPSGLIAYAEDTRFVPTLQAIAQRAERIDHVLIETSGVALPSAAMERLQSPELAGDFVLDATLVVVDTPRLLAGDFRLISQQWDVARAGGAGGEAGAGGASGLTDLGIADGKARAGSAGDLAGTGHAGDKAGASGVTDRPGDGAEALRSAGLLFDQQLAAADVVVLNKIDDLDTDALLAAEEQVRRRAPNVRFLELAHNAQLDVRLALGLRLHQATARPQHLHGPFTPIPGAESRTLDEHGRIDGHTHSGLMAHNHGLMTHTHFHEQDPGWLSFTLRSGQYQDIDALRTALERLAEAEPLLRCKGFALSTESGRPVLLQGVRTRVVSTNETLKQPPKVSELVLIGYHLSRSRVASTLSRLTGTVWS
jgi:cobalamin biosynthesis protein CobW